MFKAMLENATRICEAKFGNLCAVREDDGFRQSSRCTAAHAELQDQRSAIRSDRGPGPMIRSRQLDRQASSTLPDIAADPECDAAAVG